jgi:hypothetical protein
MRLLLKRTSQLALILMSLANPWLSYSSGNAPRPYPEAAIEAVKRLGGAVIIDESRPHRPVVAIDLNHAKPGRDSLMTLADFDELQSLDLSWSQLDESDLSFLEKLTHLEKLDLSWSFAYQKAELKHIQGCTNLRQLDLTCCGIGDEILIQIAKGCKKLTHLTLYTTNITDKGIKSNGIKLSRRFLA